eukprot:gene22725-26987_t
MSKRIVVTGMGAVTPLATGVEQTWKRLLAGESGIPGFDPDTVIPAKEQRKMDRFIVFALAAAQEALAQAGWSPQTPSQQERTATIIASGVGGFPAIAEAVRTADSKGPRRLSPFTIPSFLGNMAAGHVSIQHQLKGPLGSPVTACAAVSLGGFAAARALSSDYNDTPALASRPFDQGRDGFVMGEGAGLLVIEELEHALARGATPIAELVGYGTSADAYHMTSGPEDGSGARRAMELAIAQAGISAAQIQHLNAHATSTPVGDNGELAAINTLFGANASVAISATKSATGHLLGAAGGIEAIFTVLALRDQIAPATLNLDNPDPAAEGLDMVRGQARPLPIEYAISNGFGFGGVNASVLFKRWQ